MAEGKRESVACVVCMFRSVSKNKHGRYICAPPGVTPAELVDMEHGECKIGRIRHHWLDQEAAAE